jgi:hypothetical protein
VAENEKKKKKEKKRGGGEEKDALAEQSHQSKIKRPIPQKSSLVHEDVKIDHRYPAGS